MTSRPPPVQRHRMISPHPHAPVHWSLALWRRLYRHWFLKLHGFLLYLAVFFVAYLWLLKHPVNPVTEMPLTRLDELIGFQPLALMLYLSLWFYVSLPAMLMPTLRGLILYGVAATGMCLVGLLCFYFWPTTVPNPHIDWSLYPGVAFLKNIDAAGNACPSLH